MGCPHRGATEGVRQTLESNKASRKEDSASAIRHVQEAEGTIELYQLRGLLAQGLLCPGLSTFPQEGIQF